VKQNYCQLYTANAYNLVKHKSITHSYNSSVMPFVESIHSKSHSETADSETICSCAS